MRFPVLEREGLGSVCPVCGAPTRTVVGPYDEYNVERSLPRAWHHRIEVLLDNIRSIYNVGAFFRTSDAAGISHIHLCGMTPTPDNSRLAKTALGSQEAIPWTHYLNGLNAAESLKDKGMHIWALEGGPGSVPLQHALKEDIPMGPMVLVVGNEISGVDPGILELCDRIIHIPMSGIKTSLNAAVAFGIAVYALRFHDSKP